MFVSASHVVGEWQYFNGDTISVPCGGDEVSGLLPVRRILGVDAGAVLLADVGPCLFTL